ncbi:MAG TPA: outer membrane beta-barrel protein [Candidatus Angelobacter sp.]
MRKTSRLLGLLLLLGVCAMAQEQTPTAELFGGYSFVHSSLPGQGLNANGGSASFAINPEHWLGFVADFGGYHGSVASAGVTDFTYLFGPRFSYRSKSPLTPFAHVLLGGIHQSVGGISSQNGFAMAIGGGLDLKVDSHWAWRMVQAEYLYSNLTNQQNNARISTGIVYRWD